MFLVLGVCWTSGTVDLYFSPNTEEFWPLFPHTLSSYTPPHVSDTSSSAHMLDCWKSPCRSLIFCLLSSFYHFGTRNILLSGSYVSNFTNLFYFDISSEFHPMVCFFILYILVFIFKSSICIIFSYLPCLYLTNSIFPLVY